jgi:cytochrome oxidase Cu insertion factor (SCO1/SenC/PrrC family)
VLHELQLPTTLRALLLAVSLLPFAGACARSGHDAPHNQVTMATGASAVTANAPEESFSIFEFDYAWKDQHGRDVRIQDVSGTATVVALIYTSSQARGKCTG